ncbi:uncharacterized protein [Prorops nasuta]|uniref:uncharacterized protein n=1 Tax=Prorops nasuta TaxID=863751 RepID=UPI0034CEA8EC
MQTAGMLTGTRAIILLVLLVPLVDFARALPLQTLPSIPGYIPVYIRYGDQPLVDINPALAEAFHEKEAQSKSIRLTKSFPSDIDPTLQEVSEEINENKDVSYSAVHVRQVELGRSEISEKYGAAVVKPRENLARRKPIPFVAVLKTSTNITEQNKGDLELRIKEAEKVLLTEPQQESAISALSPLKITSAETDVNPAVAYLPTVTAKETLDEAISTKLDESADEEPPLKIQRPEGILSNVYKISEIDETEKSNDGKPLNNNEYTDKTIDTKNSIEKEVEISRKKLENGARKSLEQEEDESVIKLQRPLTILSNVQKISPIKSEASERKEKDDVPSS